MGKEKGYTLLEQLIILAIASIIGVIFIPGWLTFFARLEVIKASERMYWGLQNAKSRAKQTHSTWEFLIKPNAPQIEISVNPANSEPRWEKLPFTHAQIDLTSTTFYFDKKKKAYRMQFSWKGVSNGQLGRITVTHKNGRVKRCVIVSTLLGAMRHGEEKKGKCN